MALGLVASVGRLHFAAPGQPSPATPAAAHGAAAGPEVGAGYGQLPLSFEANRGQPAAALR